MNDMEFDWPGKVQNPDGTYPPTPDWEGEMKLKTAVMNEAKKAPFYGASVRAYFSNPNWCCEIFEASRLFGVDVVALTMAMADEYSAYGPADAAQDALALTTGDDTPLGLGRGDLGPFNLHVDTALKMAQKYGLLRGRKLTRAQVIGMVQIPQTAVYFAAAAMNEVYEVFGPMREVSDQDYPGHLVQGWRQGPENRKRIMDGARKKEGASYRPNHDMERFHDRINEIKKMLEDCATNAGGKLTWR